MAKAKKRKKNDWRSATDEENALARRELLETVGAFIRKGCSARKTSDEMCAKDLLVAIRMAEKLVNDIESRIATAAKLRRVILHATPCEIVATVVDSIRVGIPPTEYIEFSVAALSYLEFAWAASVAHQISESCMAVDEIGDLGSKWRESPLYSLRTRKAEEYMLEVTPPKSGE